MLAGQVRALAFLGWHRSRAQQAGHWTGRRTANLTPNEDCRQSIRLVRVLYGQLDTEGADVWVCSSVVQATTFGMPFATWKKKTQGAMIWIRLRRCGTGVGTRHGCLLGVTAAGRKLHTRHRQVDEWGVELAAVRPAAGVGRVSRCHRNWSSGASRDMVGDHVQSALHVWRMYCTVDALSWSHAKHHGSGIDLVPRRPCGRATTNSAVQRPGVRQLSAAILRLVSNKAERPVRSPPRVANRCCGTPYLFRAEHLPCTLHPHRCKSVSFAFGLPPLSS